MAEGKPPRLWLVGVLLLCLLGGMAAWRLTQADLPGRLRLNFVGLKLLRPGQEPAAEAELAGMAGDDCHAAWLLAMANHNLGHFPLRDAALQEAVRCSGVHVQFARIIDPENLGLAELAVQEQPGASESWLWRAALTVDANPEQAVRDYWQGVQLIEVINPKAWVRFGEAFSRLDVQTGLKLYNELGLNEAASEDDLFMKAEALYALGKIVYKENPEMAFDLYRQGLALRPANHLRWLELGDMLKDYHPLEAIQAYLRYCLLGDVGNHGCYRAGLTAEAMGLRREAIEYYRRSRWSGAHERADELERRSLAPAR